MKEDNSNLSENLKSLMGNLGSGEVLPLSDVDGVPFVGIRISDEKAKIWLDDGVQCEVKPAILNINYHEETIGVCFVQLRINSDDASIYTLTYDLNNEKNLHDCMSLLNMHKYGLLIGTESKHNFLTFSSYFSADFDPRNIVRDASIKVSDYSDEIFKEVIHGFTSQTPEGKGLWDALQTIAPFEKHWYMAMDMAREEV